MRTYAQFAHTKQSLSLADTARTSEAPASVRVNVNSAAWKYAYTAHKQTHEHTRTDVSSGAAAAAAVGDETQLENCDRFRAHRRPSDVVE